MSKFNPLTYSQHLKEAGFTEAQASVQTEGIMGILDAMDSKLASKDDLKNLEQRLDSRIDLLDAKINTVEVVLTGKINNVDTKLNWLITLMGSIGILLTLLNFFHVHA